MSGTVLVAYASKSGTTTEVARRIGACLREEGLPVEVRRAAEVTSLEGYRAVVLGSAVRMGQWLPEARRFVGRFSEALRERPVAIFTVHLLARENSDESRAQRESYTAPIRACLTPVSEAFFAGRLELARLSFGERFISRMVKAEEVDARDWEAVCAWAREVAARVKG
ncbi:MAG: Protoporphyrinogen IX dehydrogenase (menaquinone) [bacterium ADurb.Bin429]|nr:MAG: Protoporphyrinogen IX dehydrogenase (menaquinone) [bacterium ADurb.Bin429]